MPASDPRIPVTFVTLGSMGTYGHLAMASEFGRVCRTLRPTIRVRLLGEVSQVPSFFRKYLDSVILLQPRPQLCSRGGRLNAPYTGEDIYRVIDWNNPGIWIFSSFYDATLVRDISRAGGRCIWMGNPMRRSFWELFQLDGSRSLFDEVVILDDVGTLEALGQQGEQPSVTTILPPPYYVRASSCIAQRDRQVSGMTVAVACGGGLVNGSDALLEKSVRSLRAILPADVCLLVFPGDVSVQASLRPSSHLKIVRGALTEHLTKCDLVICQAGYHTVHELLYFGIPGVLIPAPRLIDDQELRAVSISRATGMPMLLPSEMEGLPETVTDLLGGDDIALQDIRNRIAHSVNARSWHTSANVAWTNFLDRNLPNECLNPPSAHFARTEKTNAAI